MKSVYRVLGYLIAAVVVVQAAAIAYALFALGNWVDNGHSLDKGTEETFAGSGGLNVHGNGALVIALLAVLLLVSSFFTKTKGTTRWALITLGLVVLQFVLAIAAFSVPVLGILHAVNAFAIAAVASVAAARVVRAPLTARAQTSASAAAPADEASETAPV